MKPEKVRAKKEICDACQHQIRYNGPHNGLVYACRLNDCRRVGVVKRGNWYNNGEREVVSHECVFYLEQMMSKE